MKLLTKITLMGAAISVLIHLYLAFHYYPIKFGFSSGPSICSVNATFDCDAVAASSSSALFGIPLAVWGMSANLIIFLLVLGQWWGWSENPERLRRWALALCGGSVVASLSMAAISTTLHTYCLFCLSLYAISFIMFGCYQRTLQESFWSNFGGDIKDLLATKTKGVLAGLIAIPALAALTHFIFLDAYEMTEVDHVVTVAVSDWKMAPHFDFTVPPALVMGPPREQAKMVISEFADFRCHHCKNAFPSLDNFAKTHSNVRLEFYNFPLDGECNEGIQPNGVSCHLAYAVECAAKQGVGWDLHHGLYAHQDEVNEGSIQPDDLIRQVLQTTKANIDSLFQCVADPQTKDAVRLQAKQGIQAKVEGTPTIFVNGRQLVRGQLIPVLEGALNSM